METENELCQVRDLGENSDWMKLRDDGIFDVNNNVHCADDGVVSEAADGVGADWGVGVDDGDCSDLSEGGDGVE